MEADGISASRMRQAHVVLSAMLDAAVLDEWITRNVAHGAKLAPIRRSEAAFLEPEEVEKIALLELPDTYGLLVRVLGTVGPRFGEAAALRRRSIDLMGRRIRITESLAEIGGRLSFGTTKSHAARTIPTASARRRPRRVSRVPPSEPEALVFTSSTGAPLRHSTFRSRFWLPALRRAGLPPVGIHVLRHSAGAAMTRGDDAEGAPDTPRSRERWLLSHGLRAHLRCGPRRDRR